MTLKFLSDEWCAAAMEVINNNDDVYKGFMDPKNFNHQMYFGLLDRPEIITYFTFVEAKLTEWSTKPHADGAIDFGLRANVEHFKEAADGVTEGGKLLMAGKLKITDGNIQLAIQNGRAFNHFLLSFGQVDTDWDI